MLADRPGSFCDEGVPPYQNIYRAFSKKIREEKIARSRVPQVVVTQHMRGPDEAVLIAVNYTGRDLPCDLDIREGWKIEALWGVEKGMVPHDNAAVFSAKRI